MNHYVCTKNARSLRGESKKCNYAASLYLITFLICKELCLSTFIIFRQSHNEDKNNVTWRIISPMKCINM